MSSTEPVSASNEAPARDDTSALTERAPQSPQTPSDESSNNAQTSPATSERSAGSSGKPQAAKGGTARLVSIDFARGLAILGMFAAHVGPTEYEHPHSWAFLPFHGRAAILFAVLAGVSISIMSGAQQPAVGQGWRKALVRIGARAGLMLVLGLIMNVVYIVPVWVILAYYGGFFLLSLPFLRMGARSLGILAAFMVVGAPIISWWVRSAFFPKTLLETPLNDVDFNQLTSLAGAGEFVTTLMLTGVFPTFIWVGYVFAGMALGRLDLSSLKVGKWLTIGGAVVAAIAYGGSWLALFVFGGAQRIYQTIQPYADAEGIPVYDFLQMNLYNVHGTPPTDTIAWLLIPYAHTDTPFDGAGSVGLSLLVIGACILLQPYAARWMKPLAAVGAISLTCYVGHITVMQLLWGGEPDYTAMNALLFAVGSALFALLWQRWYGQGPLEKFIAKISSAATRRVK